MTAQPMCEPMREPGGNVVGDGTGEGLQLMKFSHARVVFLVRNVCHEDPEPTLQRRDLMEDQRKRKRPL